ncbi:MAG: hypothetical protein K8Q89_02500 [Nitrosarchaeum sp.]|nr:hypothetical protein [Nitrosarchaeum sp.]
MKESVFSPDIFQELAYVIQDIPIVGFKIQTIHNASILDSEFGISKDESIEFLKKIGYDTDSISVRKLVQLFTKLLMDDRWGYLIIEQIYTKLRKVNPSYPIEYLLFDYCLAELNEDYTDALLYLAHAYHILDLDNSFYLLLGTLAKEELAKDNDVKEFVTALARLSMPVSASSHKELFGETYVKRFDILDDMWQKLGKKY